MVVVGWLVVAAVAMSEAGASTDGRTDALPSPAATNMAEKEIYTGVVQVDTSTHRGGIGGQREQQMCVRSTIAVMGMFRM